jgi:hypothetical protein
MPATRQQVMANLAAAQRAKTAHEAVRRQIRDATDPRAARQVAAAILLDPPEHVDAMGVADLLRCVPQLGQARVALLARNGLTERDRLRDMKIAQALRIAGWLRDPSLTIKAIAA